jgi:hypothetical protein
VLLWLQQRKVVDENHTFQSRWNDEYHASYMASTILPKMMKALVMGKLYKNAWKQLYMLHLLTKSVHFYQDLLLGEESRTIK